MPRRDRRCAPRRSRCPAGPTSRGRSSLRRGADAPVLWMHGVPTSGADWRPFLERAGGVAPDLPGLRRAPPSAATATSRSTGYARFTGALVDALGLDRVRLVVHDWGARRARRGRRRNPERVERVVVINAVPLLPGYRWHRIARAWRTRGAGRAAHGRDDRLRACGARCRPGVGDTAAAGWDQGTQRAILRLYRSAPPERLAARGPRARRAVGRPVARRLGAG